MSIIIVRCTQNGKEMFWKGPEVYKTTNDAALAHRFKSTDPTKDYMLQKVVSVVQHPKSEFEVLGSALHVDEPIEIVECELTRAIFLELSSVRAG